MDQELIKLLESSGFTEKEAKVYLALLELGKGDVGEIAKISDLKRPIIYILLEGLIKRGYATQLPDKKVNTYQAIDPSVILNQLKLTTKNFSEMLPFMQTLADKGKKKPKITYIENKEGIWNIYQKINFVKEAYFISSYVDIDKAFPDAVDDWIENYKKGKIPVRGKHLLPNNPEEIKYGKMIKEVGQEVRIFTTAEKYQMDFTLYENKLAITSFEENPFMVLIESEALVNSMKPFFELAWKKGEEVK
jgi:sugar-specific transcriptional regulator TrmB